LPLVRFWKDWTNNERVLFVLLAVLALPLLLSSPSLLGIAPSFLVLLATIGVWLWFNHWVNGNHEGDGEDA
jgi:hypothetical protein